MNALGSGWTRVTCLPCPGRGRNVTNQANILTVWHLIKGHRYLGMHALVSQSGLTHACSCDQNWKEKLGLVCKAEKFIPKMLLQPVNSLCTTWNLILVSCRKWSQWIRHVCTTQKLRSSLPSAPWFPKDTPRPHNSFHSRATGKVFLVPFFDWQDIIHWEFVCGTVNRHNFMQILPSGKHGCGNEETQIGTKVVDSRG